MIELAAIKAAVGPTDLLYVADAMTGRTRSRAPASSTAASA
jgi:signal recognition particle GTPase